MSKKSKITFEDVERANVEIPNFEENFARLAGAQRAAAEAMRPVADALANISDISQSPAFQQVKNAFAELGRITSPEEQRKPEKLPKTALLIPEDGTRPDGLSTRTAARIFYKGEEKILQRPERYILSVFVYAENIEDTTAANNNAKSKMTRAEIQKYIRLRNSVFALFYLGQNLHNDVWTFCELSEMFVRCMTGKIEFANSDDPDAMTEQTRKLKMIVDLQLLRLEAQFRAVDKFCETYSLPEFLIPQSVTTARHNFKTSAQTVLFDEYADTVQAEEIEQMTFDYLVQRQNKFSKMI